MASRKLIEEVYKKHSEMITRICYLHLENSGDAFQEVFVEPFTREGVFESDEHKRLWLICLTIKQCNDTSKIF